MVTIILFVNEKKWKQPVCLTMRIEVIRAYSYNKSNEATENEVEK